MTKLAESLFELIAIASTRLPADVLGAINKYASNEDKGTPAKLAMNKIIDNINIAAEKSQALCQDTGSILFFVKSPALFDQAAFTNEANVAVALATEKGFLRQNSVDPLTSVNSGTNLGPGSPQFYFSQGNADEIDIRIMLKGGGCENVGAQYSLPDAKIHAGRDINGVRNCLLDAVFRAQGKGCAPGILGVCIGGDRATGYVHSKEQFLRKLDDDNPNSTLAVLENEIVEEANELGIGPMGFGGKTTLLGCKIGFLNTLPASYFVTVSYMCWAFRRQGIIIDDGGNIKKWIY